MDGTSFLQCLPSRWAVFQAVLLLLCALAWYFLLSSPQAPFLQPLLPFPQFPLSHARGGRYEDADAGDASAGDAQRMAHSAPEVASVHASMTCFQAAVATFVFMGLKSHGKGDQEPVTATNAFPIVPYIMLFHTVY